MSRLERRRKLLPAAKENESRIGRGFLAPQREHVKHPIPAQSREVTLAKRAARKQAA